MGKFIDKHYISETEEDHQAWYGICESRLRLLIAGLESPTLGTFAYPYAKATTQITLSHHSRVSLLCQLTVHH